MKSTKVFSGIIFFIAFLLLSPKFSGSEVVLAEDVGGIPLGPKIVCTASNNDTSPFEQVSNNWGGDCTPTEVIVTTLTLEKDPDLFESILKEMIANGLRPVIRIASSEQVGSEWQLPGGGATEMYNAGVNLASILNKLSDQFCDAPIAIPFNEPNLPDEMGGLSGQEAIDSFAQLTQALLNGIGDAGGRRGWKLFFPPLALNPDASDQSEAISWLEQLSQQLDLDQFDGAAFTLYGENAQQLADLYNAMAEWFQGQGFNDFLIAEIGGWQDGSPLVDKETFTAIIEAFLQGMEDGSISLLGNLEGILLSFFIDQNGDGKADLTCFVYFDETASGEQQMSICCYDGNDPDALDDPDKLSCLDCYVPNHNHYESSDDDCPANEWVRMGDCSDPLQFTNAGYPLMPVEIVYGEGEQPRPECEALLDCETGLPATDRASFACPDAYIGELYPAGKPFEDEVQEHMAWDYELGPKFKEFFVEGVKEKGADLIKALNLAGPLPKLALPFTSKAEKRAFANFFDTPTQTDKRSLVRYFIKPSGSAIDRTPGFARGAVLMSDKHDEEKITEIWCRTSHLLYSSVARLPLSSGILDVVPFDCEAGRPTPHSAPNVPGKKPKKTSSLIPTSPKEKPSWWEKLKAFLKPLAKAEDEAPDDSECAITITGVETVDENGNPRISFTVGGVGDVIAFNDINYEVFGPNGKIGCGGVLGQSGGVPTRVTCPPPSYPLHEGDLITILAFDHQVSAEQCPGNEASVTVAVGESTPGGGGSSGGGGTAGGWPPYEKDYCVKQSGTLRDEQLCISSAHARVPIKKVTQAVKIKVPSPIAGTPDCAVKALQLIPFSAEEWTQYPMVYSITSAWLSPIGTGTMFMPPNSPAIKVKPGGTNVRETNWIQYLTARTAGINPRKLFFTEIPFRKYTQRQIWKPLEGYPSETINHTKQDYYAAYGVYETKRGFGDGVTTHCTGDFCPIEPPKEGEEKGRKADIPIGVVPRINEFLSLPDTVPKL